MLWSDWRAFWTCILFGNTEISVLCVYWLQRSNVTEIWAFIAVSGHGGFSDGVTLLFFVFPLLWLFVPRLSSLSVCPLRNPCSLVQCCSACSVSLEQDFHGVLLYFILRLLFFCVYVHLLCISCYMEKVLLRFINSSLVGWSVCSLATSEILDVLSEYGMFQVFLEHILVIVPQRLRLSMSQTYVQLSPRCNYPRTRCETLKCFWEKYTHSSSLFNNLYWNPILWII